MRPLFINYEMDNTDFNTPVVGNNAESDTLEGSSAKSKGRPSRPVHARKTARYVLKSPKVPAGAEQPVTPPVVQPVEPLDEIPPSAPASNTIGPHEAGLPAPSRVVPGCSFLPLGSRQQPAFVFHLVGDQQASFVLTLCSLVWVVFVCWYMDVSLAVTLPSCIYVPVVVLVFTTHRPFFTAMFSVNGWVASVCLATLLCALGFLFTLLDVLCFAILAFLLTLSAWSIIINYYKAMRVSVWFEELPMDLTSDERCFSDRSMDLKYNDKFVSVHTDNLKGLMLADAELYHAIMRSNQFSIVGWQDAFAIGSFSRERLRSCLRLQMTLNRPSLPFLIDNTVTLCSFYAKLLECRVGVDGSFYL